MNHTRHRMAALCLPLGVPKTWRYFFMLLVLTSLSLALCMVWPLTVGADQRFGYNAGPAASYPGQVFSYPREGQSPLQMDRDRYECHIWAMGQSGYDPSLPPLPVRQPVRVEPVPPVGHDTTFLAFTGALLGAIIGGHRHSGEGALIGGAIGAMTGIISDSARAETARRIEADRNRQSVEYNTRMEDRAGDYRRAMGACLEGRGYSVK